MIGRSEPTVSAVVHVTFLRMDRAPIEPGPALPATVRVERLTRCTLPFYRFLYARVGNDYLWWLRRTVPDAELEAVLEDPRVSVHVLYADGEPAGFYELDRRMPPGTNLAYFGLLPHAVGRGWGRALLRHAVDTAWAEGCAWLTVNTCTADHPRALPNYHAAGFRTLRVVREVWRIPTRLGLVVPERLLAG
ncbi:GNAT family N-acetyltransferase [Roseomonas sp. NAR14]|uniref:GNAT family N-acetyltransferase n=1 Tax=Roseomonas acroporae TaxID=2937791 RepID=A0A9X1Y9I8_9PROT|nr:GNAT family N-acetyltransferase [Roseomonas acroporae]MCK8786384.1 GNAT family N-acetyltransferase [Roseomonas acroporae]